MIQEREAESQHDGGESSHRSERKHTGSSSVARKSLLFVNGVVVGVAAGAAIGIYGLSWVRQHLQLFAAAMFIVFLLSVIAAVLVLRYRRRILGSVGLPSDVSLRDVGSRVALLLDGVAKGATKSEEIGDAVDRIVRSLVSIYVWNRAWTRTVLLVLTLFGASGAFVGASLLSEQNRFLREQNVEIRRQIDLQATQLDVDNRDRDIVRRAQLLETLYDCDVEADFEVPDLKGNMNSFLSYHRDGSLKMTSESGCSVPSASARARKEAMLALFELERSLGESVDFHKVLLNGVSFHDFDLSGVRLLAADLTESSMWKVTFEGAVLSSAQFRGARLPGTDFSSANLMNTNFSEAELGYNRFNGARLSGTIFHNTELEDSTFHKAELNDSYIVGSNLSGVSFEGADISGTKFDRSKLSRSRFSGARLRGVSLRWADLRGADLREAKLLGGGTVPLLGVGYWSLDLMGTNLIGTRFHGADLRNVVNLTQAQINVMCGDDETQIPEGHDKPVHWIAPDSESDPKATGCPLDENRNRILDVLEFDVDGDGVPDYMDDHNKNGVIDVFEYQQVS